MIYKLVIAGIILFFSIAANASTEQGIQALRARDYPTAFNFLLPAATAGDATAQFSMCGMYFQGQGVPKNEFEAFAWCKLAAEQGHLEAIYNLALFYQKGSGVGQNFNEAIKWYQVAAERGHKDAQFNLLQVLNSNAPRVQAQTAQQQNGTNGQRLVAVVPPVGVALDANGNPVTMNPLKAVSAPPPQAQIPQAIPQAAPPQQAIQQAQNPPQASPQQQQLSKWQQGCLQAAQRGIIADNCAEDRQAVEVAAAPAPTPAAAPVSTPEATELDTQNTIGWFEKQAELGDLAAQNNLGVMYRRGMGVEKQPERAFALFEKSAARGSANGMLNLANMYKLGEGTEQNLELSYAWYNLAADRIPAGEIKKSALANIKEISGYLSNEQIGNSLEYVTKLDETIPLEE